MNLTRTCRSLSSLYQRLVRTQWSLDSRLKHFVQQPLKFREAMAQTDALLSGSFALQYFERVVWPASDLDVFVETDRSEPLIDYLTQHEEYGQVRDTTPREYSSYGVERLLVFHRTAGERVLEIQLVLLHTPPLLAILKGFVLIQANS